jgi:ribosomal subunit interface protein
MNIPLQISFRDISHSDAVEDGIREKVAKLETYTDRIISCRVVVEAPHRQHKKGTLYHIRVDLTLPGEEIVVDRDPDDHAHEDVYIAIRDAFEAVRRQLKKSLRQTREKRTKKMKPSMVELPEAPLEAEA